MSLAPDSFFKVPALIASLSAKTNQVAGTQNKLTTGITDSYFSFSFWVMTPLPMKSKNGNISFPIVVTRQISQKIYLCFLF